MQRIMDIMLSILALLVLSPLLLTICIILRFTGEGEIFFYQPRIGFGGKIIRIIKFATMLKESPNIATGSVTLKDDPRVLPVGKFLRRTKINELPQLINVFMGDMSIIGPRPQTQRCFDAFLSSDKAEIIKVLPGLSGIGSIVFRNEEELLDDKKLSENFYDEVIMPFKGRIERWYVHNQSFYLYVTLILITVLFIFKPRIQLVFYIFRSLPKPPKILWDRLF